MNIMGGYRTICFTEERRIGRREVIFHRGDISMTTNHQYKITERTRDEGWYGVCQEDRH